jgi:3D (Asp-Asp-Asp) domain-containing protein
MTDWGHAVVVDPKELDQLRRENLTLSRHGRRLRTAAYAALTVAAVAGVALFTQSSRATHFSGELAACHTTLGQSHQALSALSTSHEQILDATAHAPSVGTHSWGRRFEVTMYLARSEDYGRFNDGFTATMKKADPKARIVAVDPKLIPYGSRVWVEDLGWYNAEDCGVAIKGFRLDLMAATRDAAMEFGRQRRFVIVVPPVAAGGSSAPASGMLGWPTNDARISEAGRPVKKRDGLG